MSTPTITPSKLPKLLASGALVIDVRTAAEFRSVHVKGAQLHVLDSLSPEAIFKQYGKEAPIYILCQSGQRASMAAEKLSAAGRDDIYVVEGGTLAAIEAGVAVVRGKGVISIERQVRIAAGGLVFAGTLLGLLVHAGFFGIPAFVGAGLTFAGVTNSCGMGMMLAKCPWNG